MGLFGKSDSEALSSACRKGKVARINELLAGGADPNKADKLGTPPLVAAAESGEPEAVRALLKRGAKPNVTDQIGLTALHWAAVENSTEGVRLLVEARAAVDCRDHQARTPLHAAAKNCNVDMVAILLGAGAAVDAADAEGSTPLHELVKGWKPERREDFQQAAMALLSAGAAADAPNKQGNTPAQMASVRGVPLPRLHKKSLEEIGEELRAAAAAGEVDTIVGLLRSGPKAAGAVSLANEQGETALHFAARAGQVEALRTLLAHNADPARNDAMGLTPLHYAADFGEAGCVRALADAGASLAAADIQGRQALHLACLNGHVDAALALTSKGADVAARAHNGTTPLHVACEVGQLGAVTELLLLDPRLANLQNDTGQTPLHCAAMAGQAQVVEVLCKAGAAVEALDANKATPLHCAAEKGSAAVVQVLIDHGASVTCRNAWGATPLHCANEPEVVWVLVAAGADLRATDSGDCTPLLLAAGTGRTKAIQALVKSGASLADTLPDGSTVLHLACGVGQQAAVEELIVAGANPSSRNADGATPLLLACCTGNEAIVRTLLTAPGAQLSLELQGKEGQTPLLQAARSLHVGILKALLDNGARADAVDSKHASALHAVVQCWSADTAQQCAECTKALLAVGADPQAPNADGYSALSLAAMRNAAELQQLLAAAVAERANSAKRNVGSPASTLSGYEYAPSWGPGGAHPAHARVQSWGSSAGSPSGTLTPTTPVWSAGAGATMVNAPSWGSPSPAVLSTGSWSAGATMVNAPPSWGSRGPPAPVPLSRVSPTPGAMGSGTPGPVPLGQDGSCGLQSWQILWHQIEKQEKIGEGGFGEVWKAKYCSTPVVIKQLKVDRLSAEMLDNLQQEARVMMSLRHTNIVMFMGFCQEPPTLVMELCPRGSLDRLLAQGLKDVTTQAMLTWRLRLDMLVDASRGMLYLHDRFPPIIHRDLKSPNLFLAKDFTVKVADFGLSKPQVEQMTKMQSRYDDINPRWLAPELVTGTSRATPACDVFAFGVVMWEMLTWEVPWAGLNSYQIVHQVVTEHKRPPLPSRLPGPGRLAGFDEYMSLMNECWAEDPLARPAFKDIVARLEWLAAQQPREAGGAPFY